MSALQTKGGRGILSYQLVPTEEQQQALEQARSLHGRVFNEMVNVCREQARSSKLAVLQKMRWELMACGERWPDLTGLHPGAVLLTLERVWSMAHQFLKRFPRVRRESLPILVALDGYPGWQHGPHGEGWRLSGDATRYDAVWLHDVGLVPLAGEEVAPCEPSGAKILRKADEWFLEVHFPAAKKVAAPILTKVEVAEQRRQLATTAMAQGGVRRRRRFGEMLRDAPGAEDAPGA